ncbi:hypothetical protein U1Q18_032332 [Sarracenia purpurea var. burkii]
MALPLICSELDEAHLHKKLNDALSGHVEALLDGAGDDTWPAIRKLFRRETESAVSGFSVALSSFDMDEQTKGKMLASLEDYARGVVESKTKEEVGRVLIRMKDSQDSDSMPRVWTGKEDIRAITKMARSAKTLVVALVDPRSGAATNRSSNISDERWDLMEAQKG